MTDIVITSAKRTPVGSFNGAFGALPASYLGETVIREVVENSAIEPDAVSEVILGQILIAAQGMNPARQASINAGIPIAVPAWIVNQMCGSGLRAIALGAQAIATGDSTIVVAGGQESMSQAPHAAYMRSGKKMGDVEFVDTMIRDGLWDAFNGYHMGTGPRPKTSPANGRLPARNKIRSRWPHSRRQQQHAPVVALPMRSCRYIGAKARPRSIVTSTSAKTRRSTLCKDYDRPSIARALSLPAMHPGLMMALQRWC